MMEPMQLKDEIGETRYITAESDMSETRKKMIEKYPFFGCCSLIYGIVFTACMYKNLHGVASSILICATFAYAYVVLRKLGCVFRKVHILYAVLGALLGVNLMFTADGVLIFVDYLAILLVFITGVFSVLYDNSDWDFADSCKAVFLHIFGSLTECFCIGYDYGAYSEDKEEDKEGIGKYILIGILVAIPLLVVVMLLLSSADVVFGNMAGKIFDNVDFATIVGIALMLVGAMLGSYAWLVHFTDSNSLIKHKNAGNGEPVILVTIGIILGVVYLIFCGIQVIYLFAGAGTLPDGYTYAGYAREGFFELLFVCIINLFIVLIGIKRFKVSRVLNAVLTIITGCTYIMIASSAYRMYLYISIYQLSILRLWVLWTLVWLGFILTGALINIYYKGFSLFTYSMIATSVLYLVLAYARPAYVVADYNLNTITDETQIDYSYIAYEINYDAMIPIAKYVEDNYDEGSEYLEAFFASAEDIKQYKRDTSARKFNISEYTYYQRSYDR